MRNTYSTCGRKRIHYFYDLLTNFIFNIDDVPHCLSFLDDGSNQPRKNTFEMTITDISNPHLLLFKHLFRGDSLSRSHFFTHSLTQSLTQSVSHGYFC